jgi:hypothetical protein
LEHIVNPLAASIVADLLVQHRLRAAVACTVLIVAVLVAALLAGLFAFAFARSSAHSTRFRHGCKPSLPAPVVAFQSCPQSTMPGGASIIFADRREGKQRDGCDHATKRSPQH